MTNFTKILWIILLSFNSRAQNKLSYYQNIAPNSINNPLKKYAILNDQSYNVFHNEFGYSRRILGDNPISWRLGLNFQYERLSYGYDGTNNYSQVQITQICQNINLYLNNEIVISLFKIGKSPMQLSLGVQLSIFGLEFDKTIMDKSKFSSDWNAGLIGKIFQNTNLIYPIKKFKNNGALELSAGYGFQVYAENFFIDRYNYFRLGLNWKMGKKDRESGKVVSAP